MEKPHELDTPEQEAAWDDEDAPDDEPCYRDGSPQNECWRADA